MSLNSKAILPLVRGFLGTVWMGGFALLLGFACLPLMLVGRNTVVRVTNFWARGVLLGFKYICGITVEVRGLEHLADKDVLLAIKHQGGLDFIAPQTFLPLGAFVMKQELLKVPVLGWYAHLTGQIVINREGGAATMRSMIKLVRERFNEGRQIIIFPEGTRKAPGAPPDYKPGIAGLYKELNVACTPMATNSGLYWPAKGMAKYPGVAVFEFLPPIPPGLKRAEFMRELQSRIETASNALLEEARKG